MILPGAPVCDDVVVQDRDLVIFLDIDGVLKTPHSVLAGFSYDPVAAQMLNRLCALKQTKVVFSGTDRRSSWVDNDPRLAEKYLSDLGLPDARMHEHWRTQVHPERRHVEIGNWLAEHADTSREHYIMIDDESFNISYNHSRHVNEIMFNGWIHFSPEAGMTYHAAHKLRELYEMRTWSFVDEPDTETKAGT